MKRSYKFQRNPAFAMGVALIWINVFANNVLELQGLLSHMAHFLGGMGVGLAFVGLLAGAPRTRPLFHRLRAFKRRWIGRGEGSPC